MRWWIQQFSSGEPQEFSATAIHNAFSYKFFGLLFYSPRVSYYYKASRAI